MSNIYPKNTIETVIILEISTTGGVASIALTTTDILKYVY